MCYNIEIEVHLRSSKKAYPMLPEIEGGIFQIEDLLFHYFTVYLKQTEKYLYNLLLILCIISLAFSKKLLFSYYLNFFVDIHTCINLAYTHSFLCREHTSLNILSVQSISNALNALHYFVENVFN